MKHTLIKLDDYYIVVSDENLDLNSNEKCPEWDLVFDTGFRRIGKFGGVKRRAFYTNNVVISSEKATWTSSTKNILNVIASQNPEHNLPSITFSDEVAKELGVVDIWKLSDSLFDENHPTEGQAYRKGYKQALSDNKERKYTGADLRKALDTLSLHTVVDNEEEHCYSTISFGEIIKSLNPTQWECLVSFRENSIFVEKLL